MKKYYAVIDTNVLVAVHLSRLDDSAVVQVFNEIINSEIISLYQYLAKDKYLVYVYKRMNNNY